MREDYMQPYWDYMEGEINFQKEVAKTWKEIENDKLNTQIRRKPKKRKVNDEKR